MDPCVWYTKSVEVYCIESIYTGFTDDWKHPLSFVYDLCMQLSSTLRMSLCRMELFVIEGKLLSLCVCVCVRELYPPSVFIHVTGVMVSTSSLSQSVIDGPMLQPDIHVTTSPQSILQRLCRASFALTSSVLPACSSRTSPITSAPPWDYRTNVCLKLSVLRGEDYKCTAPRKVNQSACTDAGINQSCHREGGQRDYSQHRVGLGQCWEQKKKKKLSNASGCTQKIMWQYTRSKISYYLLLLLHPTVHIYNIFPSCVARTTKCASEHRGRVDSCSKRTLHHWLHSLVSKQHQNVLSHVETFCHGLAWQ